MQHRPFHYALKFKFLFPYSIVTIVAIFLAEVTLWRLQSRFDFHISWSYHTMLVILSTILVDSIASAFIGRAITQRLNRDYEIIQAWLRGNLALRIADPISDELGQIGTQLDLLAEHLEEDEEDLDELRERNTRLTDQVRALAVVEERNRLARELHDSVKQHLFSLAMTTSAIRMYFDALPDVTDDLKEMVQEAEKAAQTAQRETTRLIEDLRPGSLETLGLAVALNNYTLLFGAQEHLLIYLDVDGEDKRLPPPVADALYRVAQEALHNVARHAQATRVDVHLRCAPQYVSLVIEDNGIGFDTQRAHQGLGLTNMQERVMAVGGRVMLSSQPGTGTRIQAEVTLPHPLSPFTPIAGTDTAQQTPNIKDWAWLGQKLFIPVGQTWPWLPADQVHLRQPWIEPEATPVILTKEASFMGLGGNNYILQSGQQQPAWVHIHGSRAGHEWEIGNASWALRQIRGLNGRRVLFRNGQPLAAMQYQGPEMHTWSEIVYDGRGYRLTRAKSASGRGQSTLTQPGCSYILTDIASNELLCAKGLRASEITLQRAIPLFLLIMVALRIMEEVSTANYEEETLG